MPSTSTELYNNCVFYYSCFLICSCLFGLSALTRFVLIVLTKYISSNIHNVVLEWATLVIMMGIVAGCYAVACYTVACCIAWITSCVCVKTGGPNRCYRPR